MAVPHVKTGTPLVLAMVPEGVRSFLDLGCGGGDNACHLLNTILPIEGLEMIKWQGHRFMPLDSLWRLSAARADQHNTPTRWLATAIRLVRSRDDKVGSLTGGIN